MDYMLELRSLLTKFTTKVPASGFEVEYLQRASELYDLYTKSISLMERNPNANKEFNSLLDEVKSLI